MLFIAVYDYFCLVEFGILCRLERWESYQRYFSGKEKLQEDCQIGALMIRSIWRRNSQMFYSTWFNWLMYVGLTLAEQPYPKYTKMLKNILLLLIIKLLLATKILSFSCMHDASNAITTSLPFLFFTHVFLV